MFCLTLWFWLPKNVNNLGPKSHGIHWLSTSVPAMIKGSVSETAGNSTTTLLFIPQRFFMQHITLLQSDDCCGFTFRILLHTSCGFFSPLNAASCLHWSFSSKTFAHFDCGFCEGLFQRSSDKWPIEITVELSSCCQGNTSSLLLFMRSRDWLLTSSGEGRCQSLVLSWLHRALWNLEDLLNRIS